MDKKTIIALALCAGILFSWPHIIKTFFPKSYDRIYKKKAKSGLMKGVANPLKQEVFEC